MIVSACPNPISLAPRNHPMSETLDAVADDNSQPRRPHSPSPPAPAAAARGCGFTGCFLAVSVLLNLVGLAVAGLVCAGSYSRSLEDSAYPETHVWGEKTADDKVALVHVDGVLVEGLLDYPFKQIEKAAKDKKVKAVVLRVNSPGGSVTASAELHQRVLRLREGDAELGYPKKPLVVSMGAVAASGGYYVSVVGQKIYAEETTLTGSVGVYAAFPSVKGIEKQTGFSVEIIKAGEIKAAGSIFSELSPKDRQVLQDMVDEAYVQFLDVIEKGRPALTREKMLERFEFTPINPDPKVRPEAKPYERYRADGGTFSGPRAKKLELVDEIGGVEDAVKEAAKLAGLDSYQTIKYAKPRSLSDVLLSKAEPPAALDLERLEHALMPRLWHLAPGYEAAAFTASARAAR